jgi:hypothetical protein
MSNYSRGEVVLIRYPFSDLSGSKVRPAVVASAPHKSKDVLILPLTSRTASLLAGEFILRYAPERAKRIWYALASPVRAHGELGLSALLRAKESKS